MPPFPLRLVYYKCRYRWIFNTLLRYIPCTAAVVLYLRKTLYIYMSREQARLEFPRTTLVQNNNNEKNTLNEYFFPYFFFMLVVRTFSYIVIVYNSSSIDYLNWKKSSSYSRRRRRRSSAKSVLRPDGVTVLFICS